MKPDRLHDVSLGDNSHNTTLFCNVTGISRLLDRQSAIPNNLNRPPSASLEELRT